MRRRDIVSLACLICMAVGMELADCKRERVIICLILVATHIFISVFCEYPDELPRLRANTKEKP